MKRYKIQRYKLESDKYPLPGKHVAVTGCSFGVLTNEVAYRQITWDSISPYGPPPPLQSSVCLLQVTRNALLVAQQCSLSMIPISLAFLAQMCMLNGKWMTVDVFGRQEMTKPDSLLLLCLIPKNAWAPQRVCRFLALFRGSSFLPLVYIGEGRNTNRSVNEYPQVCLYCDRLLCFSPTCE